MRPESFLFCIALAGLSLTAWAQYNPSIHEEQSNFYSQYNFTNEADYDALMPVAPQMKASGHNTAQACSLEYAVYGWHPYWVGTAYTNYDFSLLSTFCYFSYEMVPSTGSYSSIHSWRTTPSITMAQAAGTRVELCVTNFGSSNNTTFLSSSTAQQTFIDSIISLLNYRNADGVNIDFEGVPGSMRNNLTAFMTNLSSQLKAAITGATVTMAVYSVDWSSVFDIPALDGVVDQFIIMGYGYYYSGSSKAGPTAEFYKGTIWSSYNLVRSVNYYLNEGVTPVKLVLGLPYYGYEWHTVDNTIASNTVASIGSRTYAYVQNNYTGTYPRNWDQEGFNPYYIYQSGSDWRQAWVDDEFSLGYRYDMVKQKGIGGIGIWALGYDNGYSALWDLLYEKFTNCGTVPCSDTIYDTGGPFGDHYNNEDYSFTIAPTNSNAVSLSFSTFSLESGYDSLCIYDGSSTSSPLIGGYSGTGSPGTVISSGNAMTIRFFSDGATINSGWEAVWDCINDSISPTTSISHPNAWETMNFIATFTDADQGGSGLNERYYQVLELNSTEWRANEANGFFSDEFDLALHTDWINASGAWTVSGGNLSQSDESNGNTNLYATLNQTGSQAYLYHWKAAMLTGSSSNKRQGIHFFSDDASQTERGNSYFVYFREEDDECQIFKVVNNAWTMMQSASVILLPDVVYDYKVVYNPATGKIEAFVDNNPTASWTDQNPYIAGGFVSLRTGNANTVFDDLKVYKSRAASVTVTVGSSSFNDIRYENPSPVTPSCRIVSVVNDSAGNWSNPAVSTVNIDWTPASDPVVLDGVSADIDTTCELTQLSANWNAAVDSNSGVIKYYYSIGTSPGVSDVVTWVDNGLSTNVLHTGLALQNGMQYYFNLKTQNGAGLFSSPASSDGQVPAIPNASISSDVTVLTLPDSVVNFIDVSSGADSWSWTFPGGSPSTSTAQNPVVSYTTPGSYNVSLTVVNTSGCSSSQTLNAYVVVSGPSGSPPIASFNSNINAGCPPLDVNFFDASANEPDSLFWTFTGGNIANSTDTAPSVTYTQPGVYEVTLQAFNPYGEDSITMTTYITIFPTPVAAIGGDADICTGESSELSGSGGTSYSWNTGQTLQTIMVSPAVNTTYSLMVMENGCISLPAFFNVSVSNAPEGVITNDQKVCAGDLVTLQASGGDTYLWNTGAMLDSISVQGTDSEVTYTVQVTKNNCPDTVVLSCTVGGAEPPTASFSATDTVLFKSYATATFTNASSNATGYFWAFGDGNTANGTHPWNTYPDTGMYDVTLVALSTYCPNDTLIRSQYIQVLPDPVVPGIHDEIPRLVELYPNPFSNVFYIRFNTGATLDFCLSDILGNEVYRSRHLNLVSGDNIPVDLSGEGLCAGVYIATLNIAATKYHFRLMKN